MATSYQIYTLSLVTVKVSMKLDNVNSQNYFFICKCEKQKEVIKYGMGTDEHTPF